MGPGFRRDDGLLFRRFGFHRNSFAPRRLQLRIQRREPSRLELRPRRERIVEHVAEKQDYFHQALSQLLDLPIVGDLRGTGFFYALELVKDKETRETFNDEECETLLRGFLSPRLFEAGLICRADDRGDPVIQISPPLVADTAEIDEIVSILGEVLSEASVKMRG